MNKHVAYQAHQAGYKAFSRGTSRTKNPHAKPTQLRTQWLRGWYDAFENYTVPFTIQYRED